MIRDELARLIKDGYNALGELEFAESSNGYLLYHWADRNSLHEARISRSIEDFFYPGAIATWLAYRAGTAHPICLRQTLNRQTGMYRVTRKLTDDQAQNLVKEACRSDSRCLRTILWGIEDNRPPDFLPSSKSDPSVDQTGEKRAALPFLCLEACNLLVAAARTGMKKSSR
jgi:hypothetical protein